VRVSLETEVARDVDGIGAGVFAGVLIAASGVDFCKGVGAALRFRDMMFVSSCLNVSRSTYATAEGEVNVKLCPASSLTSPSLRRT
jgi:hypothetical protein